MSEARPEDTVRSRQVITDEGMQRIRSYLSSWAGTVEAPEGVPLAQQLLDYADALVAERDTLRRELDDLRAVGNDRSYSDDFVGLITRRRLGCALAAAGESDKEPGQ